MTNAGTPVRSAAGVSRASFRNDIQGLRGLAVLMVVVYHTGLGLPWGFVGVDMFFVISGFVITQLLVDELEGSGRVGFREFYARRARRLLPALSIVTVFVLVVSLFIMSPFGEQQEIATTSQSATLFMANAYFFLQKSYFALSMNPFRHTWSLAVEEQFYLLFPVLLVLIWKFGRRFEPSRRRFVAALLVLGISVVSFVGSLLMSFGYRIVQLPTRFAFYGTPARIWEFGVGIVLALLLPYVNKKSERIGWALAIFGTGIFAFACSRISAFSPFPGVIALGPVLGTALLILAGTKSVRVSALLAFRPLKLFGDVSYGWYIWHWPLIVFADVMFPGRTTAKVLAAALALVPSLISYRLVEQPIRRDRSIVGRKAVRLVGICIVVPLIVSVGVSRAADTGLGLSVSSAKVSNPSLADVLGCQVDNQEFDVAKCVVDPASEGTETASSGRTVLLLGDSQAGAASDGVAKAASELGMKFAVWYNNGCPVFPRPNDERDDCPHFLAELSNVIALLKPDVIVVVNSSTLYTTRGAQRGGVSIRLANGGLPKNYDEAVRSWVDGLHLVLSSDLFSSVPVLLVQEVPESFDSPRVSLLRRTVNESRTPLRFFYDRNHVISAEASGLKAIENLQLFDPVAILCPNAVCETTVDGQYVYTDRYHLSPFGSRLLSDSLKVKIIEALD